MAPLPRPADLDASAEVRAGGLAGWTRSLRIAVASEASSAVIGLPAVVSAESGSHPDSHVRPMDPAADRLLDCALEVRSSADLAGLMQQVGHAHGQRRLFEAAAAVHCGRLVGHEAADAER